MLATANWSGLGAFLTGASALAVALFNVLRQRSKDKATDLEGHIQSHADIAIRYQSLLDSMEKLRREAAEELEECNKERFRLQIRVMQLEGDVRELKYRLGMMSDADENAPPPPKR